MGTWNDVLNEVTAAGSNYDIIRRNYIRALAEYRKRNLIIYYSGWLQKPQLANEPAAEVQITDSDKVGFMSAIKGMDPAIGLDLVLHTPGGDMAATESLVDYLRVKFPNDISVFVPQLAMSAGTMIACACKEIWMGNQSSLGPIDPQVGHLPANAILEEFETAAREIKNDSSRAFVWQPILSKLQPSAITQCKDALKWGEEVTEKWLAEGMFASHADPMADAKATVANLTDKAKNKAHARHLSADVAESYGLNIRRLETDQRLQDAVLTLHHAVTVTLNGTGAYKIIENHLGGAYLQVIQQIAISR